MKVINIFLIVLILLPGISAELSEVYLDKTIQVQNDYIKSMLDNRDENINKQINTQIEKFKDTLDAKVSIYALKFGLIFGGIILFCGIMLISLYIFIITQFNKMQKIKLNNIKKSINGV